MTNLPTKQGDTVYADTDGVNIFKNPGFDSDAVGNWATNGDVVYNKGSLLGTFTGNKFGEFYEIKGSAKVRVIPLVPKRNISFVGWVSGNQITTVSIEEEVNANKSASDAAYQKQLDAALGNGNNADGSTTASGATTTTKSNTMIYIFGGLALLLGGLYLYMTRKKKPMATQIVQPNKPLITQ